MQSLSLRVAVRDLRQAEIGFLDEQEQPEGDRINEISVFQHSIVQRPCLANHPLQNLANHYSFRISMVSSKFIHHHNIINVNLSTIQTTDNILACSKQK